MAHNLINKKWKIIGWLNERDYDIDIIAKHDGFTSVLAVVITIPNLKWSMIKFRTRRRLRKLAYKVENLFLALVNYRLIDCEYDSDCRVFIHGKDISGITTKALVPRKGNKWGWALRLKTNEEGNIIAGDDGFPIYYKQYGEMSWLQ